MIVWRTCLTVAYEEHIESVTFEALFQLGQQGRCRQQSTSPEFRMVFFPVHFSPEARAGERESVFD